MAIDFDDLPVEHVTMIHVPFESNRTTLGVLPLLAALYQAMLLDSMAVEIRAPHTACSCESPGIVRAPTQLCVMFNNAWHDDSIKRAPLLKDLWAFLLGQGLNVTWKHGAHGYEIGPGFVVLNSWRLLDHGE